MFRRFSAQIAPRKSLRANRSAQIAPRNNRSRWLSRLAFLSVAIWLGFCAAPSRAEWVISYEEAQNRYNYLGDPGLNYSGSVQVGPNRAGSTGTIDSLINGNIVCTWRTWGSTGYMYGPAPSGTFLALKIASLAEIFYEFDTPYGSTSAVALSEVELDNFFDDPYFRGSNYASRTGDHLLQRDASGQSVIRFPVSMKAKGKLTIGSEGPYVGVKTGHLTTILSAAPTLLNLHIVEPDPNGDPVVRGENEYTMAGGSTPFVIPCVVSADNSLLGMYKTGSTWEMSRSLPGALPAAPNGSSGGSNNQGTFFPQFYPSGSMSPMPGLGFNGMPSNNNDFGPRTIKHNLKNSNDGSVLKATSPIEVFYSSSFHTHPADGSAEWCSSPSSYGIPGSTTSHRLLDTFTYANAPNTPNWFYYYNQVWKNPWQTPVTYQNQTSAYFLESTNSYLSNHIHVGNASHGSSAGGYGAALFAIPSGKDYVEHVGWDDVRGLDSYARTVTHECVHKRLYESMQTGPTDYDVDPNGTGDHVGDGVPDVVEMQVGLDPSTTNTTRFDDDNEVFCRMVERQVPLVNAQDDWADDGLNKGTPPPPNLTQRIVRNISSSNQYFLTWTDAYGAVP